MGWGSWLSIIILILLQLYAVSSCTRRTKGHEIIRDGQCATVWLRSSGRGRKSQCASAARVNLSDYSVGRYSTRLHDNAKMWQWGNSVSVCCIMLPWSLTYCEGDERKKMVNNGFSIWWKVAPADRAALFKDGTEWEDMEAKFKKIRPIVLILIRTQITLDGRGCCT